jgi:hypothetical protein
MKFVVVTARHMHAMCMWIGTSFKGFYKTTYEAHVIEGHPDFMIFYLFHSLERSLPQLHVRTTQT